MSALLALALAAPVVVPLGVTVTEVDGVLSVDRAWVDARVDAANAIFAPHALRFEVVWVRGVAGLPAVTRRRADRDAFAAAQRPGLVNIFVTPRLEDIHEPGRVRRGVHWRPRRPVGAHYVILAAYSGRTVLAHELGHFLGHPRHTRALDNLMSYARSGAHPPTLSRAQGRAMHRRALWLRRSEGWMSEAGRGRRAEEPAAP